MSMFSDFPPAIIGSIIVAVVGGFVTFASAVLTKEQKTSEFRQQWIDSLRSDISEYCAHGWTVWLISTRVKDRGTKEHHDAIADSTLKAAQLYLRIRLRLRSNKDRGSDDQTHLLRGSLDDWRLALENAPTNFFERRCLRKTQIAGAFDRAFADLRDAEIRVEGHASDLLKSEWERVKRGELIFRWLKWGTLGAVVVLVLSLAYFSPSKPKGTAASTDIRISVSS